MIRRLSISAGRPDRWILISQVDHAHLAAQLAEHWGQPPFARLEPRAELLAAIEHHDDGWTAWERMPQVDPRLGQPLAFTEMPLAESLSIWRQSIAAARRLGPLAGYAVAGHFLALFKRFDSWRRDSPENLKLAGDFLTEFDRKMATWLADWESLDQTSNTAPRANRAVVYLQFFDALSLWFCCAERTEPVTFAPPGGPDVTLTPLASERIGLSPWSYGTNSLRLETPGRAVLTDRYESAEALAAARSEPVRLSWDLAPFAGSN